jgi:hypothetical protein
MDAVPNVIPFNFDLYFTRVTTYIVAVGDPVVSISMKSCEWAVCYSDVVCGSNFLVIVP